VCLVTVTPGEKVDSQDVMSTDSVAAINCQSPVIVDAVDLSLHSDNTGNRLSIMLLIFLPVL